MTRNLNILLAEDDKGHASLIQKNLWRTCIEAQIVPFSDGQKLLDYLSGNGHASKQLTPGEYIILLDIKMPRMDGIETLNAIKSDPRLCKIPVIMLTTTDSRHEIDHCYSKGCTFYIAKPSDYNKFMETIEYFGSFLSLSTLVLPDVKLPSLTMD